MIYFLVFVFSGLVAALLTIIVRHGAVRLSVFDLPRPEVERKIHGTKTPLLGGLALIFAFDLVSLVVYLWQPVLNQNIPFTDMMAIWAGSLILGLGGTLEDVFDLPPAKQFLFPLAAVVVIVIAGIGVPHITNPFGGKIALGGIFSAAFVLAWLLGMVYTTKLLDGIDGLAVTIGAVASLALFALSFTENVQQPYTAMLAIIFAGVLAGFLIFNWHPAKIFLGEGGSVFIGFILGIVAIIAGGKIATAFLVMGIPILDVGWIILRRLFAKASPFRGDSGHMHFRLLRLGLSQPQVVILLAVFSAIFGVLAVVLQSMGKLIALVVLVLLMVILALVVIVLDKRRRAQSVGIDQSADLS